MEILDASSLMNRGKSVGERAHMAQLYPSGSSAQSLLAVDLLEVEPGGSTALLEHAEEHLLFVVSGSGQIRGADGTTVLLKADSVVHVGPREEHQLRNTGSERLRVLVSTPLLVRSDRALGYATADESSRSVHRPTTETREAPSAETGRREERPQPSRVAESVAAVEPVSRPSAPAAQDGEEPPLPDISSLMKRGSDIAAGPRPERKRPVPEPEPIPVQATAESDQGSEEEEEEQEEHRELMELSVVFDGGSRGNPGQGYGSYLVQSPGRKPVIKQVEFGGNYTNNQAEYESLIACLQYIIERLTVTNRKPEQVALDIKSDSDLLVNQLQGTYKVKDAGLRQRHARAEELLAQFGEWMITWHPREESVRLLGH